MYLLIDSSELTPELRNYLPLYLDTILESPIMRGDVLIPYEEVVSELEADTIASGARIGLERNERFACGAFSQTVSVILQV